jgi:hypothetical protein
MFGALRRSFRPAVAMALTHAVFVCVGILMVHSGNNFAIGFRDRLVQRAHANDPAAIADRQSHHVRAAMLDFSRNLFLGAVPSTLGGLAIVLPFPLAAYRGWVGGIVSIDRDHASRLRRFHSAAYYLITLVLQLLPYSLAAGAGIRLGRSYYWPTEAERTAPKWLRLPVPALRDLLWVYAVVVPCFAIASAWEFLMLWRWA